jgi:hypothetical protein
LHIQHFTSLNAKLLLTIAREPVSNGYFYILNFI